MNATTIDRRQQYVEREPAHRTPDYYGRVQRGIRLLLALNERYRRQDAGERVCK